MTPADLEAGIRERAYQLWEAAGRPQGCDLEHWLQAEAMAGRAIVVETPAAKPKRAGKPEAAAPKAAAKVKAEAPKPARVRKAKTTA